MEQCPLLVGWKEYLDFPEWKIRRVKAKIDTGARTSALDVAEFRLIEEDQRLMAELLLALHRKRPERVRKVCVPVVRMVLVANSAGVREERPLIEATIRLGPVTKRIPVTVTSRSGMRFPMILGRKALEGDFIVDVSRKYLLRSS